MRFTLHPLLRLVATKPQLLADHAEAYAELLSGQAAIAAVAWKRRVLASALACALGFIALLLVGIAAMLWAVTPVGHIHQPLVLVAAPSLPALAAIICWLLARSERVPGMFDEIKEQVQSDLAMLREVSNP